MRRAGFTLIELLVTIGIIAVLAGLLIVGVSAATRRGQMTNTRFLMSSMAQALARFNADHGYYPPVLGDHGRFGGARLDQQCRCEHAGPTWMDARCAAAAHQGAHQQRQSAQDRPVEQRREQGAAEVEQRHHAG
jgi:prepilin-type N-terminal cleavage/methylation domain-containing protein